MREKETQSKPLQLAINSCLGFAEEALESCTSLGVYCKYHPLVDIHDPSQIFRLLQLQALPTETSHEISLSFSHID